MNELTMSEVKPAPSTKRKLNPKQRAFIEYYLTPSSETFANLYRSGMKAGFSPTYSMNLRHLNPSWLSNTIEQADFQPTHIKQGIQEIALKAPQSKSPDDTRLKAYETLAKITGMMDTKQTTNITLVQPILSGMSVHKTKHDDKPIIDQEP